MNTAKKIFCILMAFVMASASFCSFVYAEDGNTELQFNSDGKFKIMLFADSQDNEELEETTTQLMREALDKYEPDLVVFLGDNTVASGYDNQYKAIEALTEPVRSRNIPYSIVFGNHDQEQGVDKEDLLEIYREFGCITYDAVPELYGCGNCNLPILSSDGSKIAFNLWMTDSGSRNHETPEGGYDFVHKDQIEWYRQTAAALAAANGGEPVPSMNFQHIVVPEIYEALYPALPFPLETISQTIKGTAYPYVPHFTGYTGFVLEPPCPPYITEGQYDAWVETGDVIATFCGHDHTNTYRVSYKGIENINVPTVGCNSYGNDLARGVGLVTLDENSPKEYTYELIHIYDMALADGSLITKVDGGRSKFEYTMIKMFGEVFLEVQKVLSRIMAM